MGVQTLGGINDPGDTCKDSGYVYTDPGDWSLIDPQGVGDLLIPNTPQIASDKKKSQIYLSYLLS